MADVLLRALRNDNPGDVFMDEALKVRESRGERRYARGTSGRDLCLLPQMLKCLGGKTNITVSSGGKYHGCHSGAVVSESRYEFTAPCSNLSLGSRHEPHSAVHPYFLSCGM